MEFRVVGTGADRRLSEGESVAILAGIQGPAGNSFGFRWRGNWSAVTQYEKDAAVAQPVDGNAYICVAGVSLNSAPPSADWEKMVDGNVAVVTHVALADPHTQYQKESEKAQANGYASLDGTGTVPDAQIPAAIARDTEVAVVATNLANHEAAADPHAQYQKESEKGQINGYASLDAGGTVPDAQIPAGITRDTELAAHVDDTTAAHAASAIANTPAGTVAATTVQAAIDELDSEKQAVSGKDAANGYCGLDANARVAEVRLGTGTGSSAKALFGDQTWQPVSRVMRFGGGFDSPTAAKNPIVARVPVAGTVTKVYGCVVGGTNAVLNAQVNANDLRSADITVSAASSWTDFGTLQNTTVAEGDYLKIEIVSVSGTPSWVAIQIEVTP